MANILLLEDNVELRTLLHQALELKNYDILSAGTGLEGLTLLNDTGIIPDAIICDLNMPEMDGATFIRHVRAKPEWAQAYIVILSGSEEDRMLALETGANHYIQKPFSIFGLANLLEANISK
jgi:two-component system chemotaxis response regulator CheY